MKKIIYLMALMFLGAASNLMSQDDIVKDLCVNFDQIDPNGYDIFSDDIPFQMGSLPFPQTGSECYFFQEALFFVAPDPRCCDTTLVVQYSYQDSDDKYILNLTIKCDPPVPKPNCTNINLSEIESAGESIDPPANEKVILYACDETPITYYVDEAPGQTIVWDAGAVPVMQSPDNVGTIIWPAAGSYSLTVTVGAISTTYCIEVLESPTADFSIAGSCGCLNTAIDFMSTGIGGNEFFWDFGDMTYGSGATTSHEYTSPGIYNVTLIVIQDNFDDDMNPLCCCSDTISMPIEILNLEGPDIFWISTLCEGDTTKYWTDAVGCTYSWTAVDSDGVDVLPPGTVITNDTLCVPWGEGPFGQVSLTVSGCTDNTYCPKPTTAIIPIIEANSTISGKDTVCLSASEFYTVPKWPTVQYDWVIDPPSAGTITSGNGTNSITVNWGNSVGTATISVNYYSDFLGGIVGHEPEDCSGFASLDVTILPEFDILGPSSNKFCIDAPINLFAGPVAPSTTYPLNFIWEVDPPVGPNTTTTLPGASPYLTSYSDPGYYNIKVYPSLPNPYCNDTVYKQIEIIEVPPMDAIDGPKEFCPGDEVTYFGVSSTPGTQFIWNILGGSITSDTGNPVTFTWNASGPYGISVYQQQINPPYCSSAPIDCPVMAKALDPSYTISGPGACVNEIMTYSVSPIPTDPDVTYEWSFSTSTAGSVVSGDTGPVVDIQWNNVVGLVTLTCTISLCDETKIATSIINVSQAAPVNITQNTDFCIGAVGVNLTASTPGASYNWTTPSPAPAVLNAQMVDVLAPGNYNVTVTESVTGCTAVASYEVFENGLPNVNLTSPDILSLCIADMGNTVELHALVGPYTYQWYKSTNGGTYVLQAETSAILTHTNSGIVGYCTYYYVATTASLCSDQSDGLTVVQGTCPVDPDPCIPEPFNTDVTSSPSVSNCNEIDFMTSNSINVNITGWSFNDPSLSNAYTGPITDPTYTFTEAGYYVVYMYGSVPNEDNTELCSIKDTNAVCIPLAADFDFTYDCGEFTFTSTSTYVTGADPNSWIWDFGDTFTGSGMMTSHMYNVTSVTIIPVTLTISNMAGCTATITRNITVIPPPVADIIAMPMDTCINKPFAFSNSNNAGIVSWDWQFGDLSTNGSPNPLHAYDTDNTYMVTLTVTDENGCTNSDVKDVIVHPTTISGDITWIGDLFLCPGETLVLNAPLGDSYDWSTGESTASISVMTTGTYGVTVTDINGCTYVPDSVDVVVYPSIDGSISGSNIICDDGCTTLYAVSSAGYTYFWEDNLGNVLTGNGIGNSVTICFADGISEVRLTITDANMCQVSEEVTIAYYNSPDVLITPSDPILCEGTPNTLTASTTYPNAVDFNWSTGEVGPSINVILEGTYYVTVTDPDTGCSMDTFININPLPDLCIVPFGCYEACDPDTICAPSGLNEYEWYFQGVIQPMYSGMECIYVTESGAYNFAGTNEYNCEAFSDTLYLELIPCCRPGDTDISAFLDSSLGSCCYSFNYALNQDIFYSLDLHSNDSDLGLDLGSVNPLLSVTSSLPSLNSFESSTSGSNLDQGPLTGFATICLENVTNNPAEIIADWRGEDGEILCSDTLYLECIVEPDCIYVQSDTIYCDDNGNLIYDLTICNPVDALYSIGYIDFLELTPAGVMLNPSEIDLGVSPLLPGDCMNFSLNVLGSGLANQTLCYNLVGHEDNPNDDPSTLCCSADSTYCIFIPGCSPCEMVYVSSIDSSDLGECCYDVTVNNYESGFDFTGINLCVLTPGATFDIFNPGTSPWDVTALTSTTANLDYNSGTSTFIPLGDTELPTICVGDNDIPYVDVEIKWMANNGVKCRDTISLLCPGDCGYMSETSLVCGPNGTWIFSGYITNTSLEVMDNAYIDFGDDLLNAYDTDINLNGLAPNATFGPFNIVLSGTTGVVGPELCVITTLHSINDNDSHEDCCQFKTIVDVPECENPVDCMCGPDFEEQVLAGMNCNRIGGSFTYEFSPIGDFGECDKVIWDWIKEQTANMTVGNQSVLHTFPQPAEYTVCMTVIRTQPDGKQCKEKFCKDIQVFEVGLVNAFPNPVTDQVNLILKNTSFEGMAQIDIVDANNRKCKSLSLNMSDQIVSSIDVSDFKTGIYMIRINMDNVIQTKRILIVK